MKGVRGGGGEVHNFIYTAENLWLDFHEARPAITGIYVEIMLTCVTPNHACKYGNYGYKYIQAL